MTGRTVVPNNSSKRLVLVLVFAQTLAPLVFGQAKGGSSSTSSSGHTSSSSGHAPSAPAPHVYSPANHINISSPALNRPSNSSYGGGSRSSGRNVGSFIKAPTSNVGPSNTRPNPFTRPNSRVHDLTIIKTISPAPRRRPLKLRPVVDPERSQGGGQGNSDATCPDGSKVKPCPALVQKPETPNFTKEIPKSEETESSKLRSISPSPIRGKAIEVAERARSVHEAAGDKVAQAIDHVELAELYVENDNLGQAFEHIAAADRMAAAANDPKLRADVLMRNGAAYMSAGEFEQAIAEYRKAMPIFRSVDDERSQAEVYASVGWAQQSLGNMPDALSGYYAALTLFGKVRDNEGAVKIRIGIGSLYQSVGDLGHAQVWYTKALSNASKGEQARIHVSVGEMYLAQNEPADALFSYEEALPLVQATGDSTLEGAVLAGMGRCEMTLGSYHLSGAAINNYDEARKFFEQARTKMKEPGDRAGEGGVIASIGELHYWIASGERGARSTRDFSEALRNYYEALHLMQEVGDTIGEVGVLTNMGLVFDAWERYDDAQSYYMEALDKMDELQTSARIEEFRIDIAAQSAGIYGRAIVLAVMQNHDEEAFNLSERARARTFLDQLGNRRIRAQLPEDFVQREEELRRENISLQRRISQEGSKPGPELNSDLIRSLESQRSSVQNRYSNLVRALKITNPEYASFLSVSPLTLKKAQQQLSPDVTAVSYFTTPSTTLAFVVTRDRIHVSHLHVTEHELAQAVTTFLDFPSESTIPPSLMSLHKWLIAPIKSKLKTAKLAVIPYGVLHDVPFAALTPDGKRYLSDDFVIFSLPSLSALPYIQARTKTNANKALVFANDKEPGRSYLGNANREASAVASLFNTQPILGQAATLSAFQREAAEYDIIHLIAHIDHDNANPEDSRVILGQGSNDDGVLDLDQVLGLDLRKASLVVLSGCESQAGKLTRGDDIVGLSRAFIYAGSPSVIASLWSVDDEATRVLMVSFYTHLRQGLGKAEALRAAQMEVRKKYPHPYYWAGFVLTGDPGIATTSDLVAQTKK
jgi:CHAT domain-containing protein